MWSQNIFMENSQIDTVSSSVANRPSLWYADGAMSIGLFNIVFSNIDISVSFIQRFGLLLLLLSTPLHQRAASRVQHPKSCGSQQSLPPGGKERLHFVGIRPEVQARKGGW